MYAQQHSLSLSLFYVKCGAAAALSRLLLRGLLRHAIGVWVNGTGLL